jgi:5'-nucleotidase (lipoprotein e(P4) family)
MMNINTGQRAGAGEVKSPFGRGMGLAGFLAGLCVLYGCASGRPNYNTDLVMGILWQQYSGEYRALCYQAFNGGKNYIRSLGRVEKGAVILDIDETVLDNSGYAAWMARSGRPWSGESWAAWCGAGEAGEVPGALDFVVFITGMGFEPFYISNRPSSVLEETLRNLAALGFPCADRDHVLLMENGSDKRPRIEAVNALGYETVLYAGDSLEDLEPAVRKWSNGERSGWVEGESGSFGIRRIVLPNPVYGTFESALAENYYALSPAERAAARMKLLKAWDGE